MNNLQLIQMAQQAAQLAQQKEALQSKVGLQQQAALSAYASPYSPYAGVPARAISLINRYNMNPRKFTAEQAAAIEQMANAYGISTALAKKRSKATGMDIAKGLAGGFLDEMLLGLLKNSWYTNRFNKKYATAGRAAGFITSLLIPASATASLGHKLLEVSSDTARGFKVLSKIKDTKKTLGIVKAGKSFFKMTPKVAAKVLRSSEATKAEITLANKYLKSVLPELYLKYATLPGAMGFARRGLAGLPNVVKAAAGADKASRAMGLLGKAAGYGQYLPYGIAGLAGLRGIGNTLNLFSKDPKTVNQVPMW